MTPVIAAIQRRLEAYQLESAAQTSGLLQGMTAELRAAFLARLKIEPLESGATLMLAGDVGDALYLVISGRLRVLAGAPDGATLAELGQGDTVGETALMTGEVRSATVVGLRDSLVARLDREAFKDLITLFPLEAMAVFAGQLAQRASATVERESGGGRGSYDRPPVSMAIVPADRRRRRCRVCAQVCAGVTDVWRGAAPVARDACRACRATRAQKAAWWSG